MPHCKLHHSTPKALSDEPSPVKVSEQSDSKQRGNHIPKGLAEHTLLVNSLQQASLDQAAASGGSTTVQPQHCLQDSPWQHPEAAS